MRPEAPHRCTLVNTATAERFICQFNPAGLQERIGAVQFTHLQPIGSGRPIMQYHSTENRRVSAEFYMDAVGTGFRIADFRRFLLSLTQPVPGKTLSSPPPVLLVWPSLLTVTARLTELSFAYEQVAADGTPLVCRAQCTFEIDERAARPESSD